MSVICQSSVWRKASGIVTLTGQMAGASSGQVSVFGAGTFTCPAGQYLNRFGWNPSLGGYITGGCTFP